MAALCSKRSWPGNCLSRLYPESRMRTCELQGLRFIEVHKDWTGSDGSTFLQLTSWWMGVCDFAPPIAPSAWLVQLVEALRSLDALLASCLPRGAVSAARASQASEVLCQAGVKQRRPSNLERQYNQWI